MPHLKVPFIDETLRDLNTIAKSEGHSSPELVAQKLVEEKLREDKGLRVRIAQASAAADDDSLFEAHNHAR